jgi:hypothetical protein
VKMLTVCFCFAKRVFLILIFRHLLVVIIYYIMIIK